MILITDAFPTIYFVHFLCITGGPLTQQGPHTLFHYPFSNSPSKETWDETPPVGRGAYCLFDNGAHRLCLKNIPGLNFGEKKLWGCFFWKQSNSTECGLSKEMSEKLTIWPLSLHLKLHLKGSGQGLLLLSKLVLPHLADMMFTQLLLLHDKI